MINNKIVLRKHLNLFSTVTSFFTEEVHKKV